MDTLLLMVEMMRLINFVMFVHVVIFKSSHPQNDYQNGFVEYY